MAEALPWATGVRRIGSRSARHARRCSIRSAGGRTAKTLVQGDERGQVRPGEVCQTIRLCMKIKDNVLRQHSVLRCDGRFRTGKETQRTCRHIPDRNDNAVRKSVVRSLFQDACRVTGNKIGPIADARVCHPPSDGRINKEQPVSCIMRYPSFGVCLVQQSGMIEPNAKTNCKRPVWNRNQTLQLQVYSL